MAVAHEKKDAEMVNGLFQKIETLGKTLGAEYVAFNRREVVSEPQSRP